MKNYFYRDKAGREVGPLSLDTLAKFRLAGVLDNQTPVRPEDSAEWKPFGEIIPAMPDTQTASGPATASAASALGETNAPRNGWVFIAVVALAIVAGLVYSQRRQTQPENLVTDAANQNPLKTEVLKKVAELQIATLRGSAEKGNANSQYELGKLYANGQGTETNFNEAVRWFRKSAEQGNAKGQNALGTMYQRGSGVEKNDAEAVKWYQMSANQGEAKGQANLGWMYSMGRGVTKDEAEAVKWFRMAAGQGDARGQLNLGSSYLNGSGVQENATEAVKWYRKAAEQDFPSAQFILGVMYEKGYEEGRVVPVDRETAVEWYFKAAKAGDQQATARLRELFSTREDTATVVSIYSGMKQTGGDAPRLNAAKQEFLKEFESRGQAVKLIDFLEVSGKKLQASGSRVQELSFQAEIEFQRTTASGVDMAASMGSRMEFEDVMHLASSKGDRIKFAGVMIGEKSDAGWRFITVRMNPVWASNPIMLSIINRGESIAKRNACINNLRQVDGAIQLWALENNKQDTDPVTPTDIKHYIKGNAMPTCPAGGTYTVTTVIQRPTCTVAGHAYP